MPLSAPRLPKVLLALAVLSPVSLCAQAASSGAGEGTASLENARRDLQTLPATNGALDQTKDPALKFSMPSAPSGNNAVKSSGSSLNSPEAVTPSTDWLLDAWRKAEVQSQARRMSEAKRSEAFERGTDKGKADAQNPFTPYLQQWISPRDQGLLQLKGPGDIYGATSSSTSVGGDIRNSSSGSQVGFGASDSSLSSTKAAPPSSASSAPNPYLATSDATKSAAGLPSVGSTQLPTTSFSSDSPSAEPSRFSSNGTSPAPVSGKAAKSAVHLAEPGYVPPTAPIIDERKYFPQLHRF